MLKADIQILARNFIGWPLRLSLSSLKVIIAKILTLFQVQRGLGKWHEKSILISIRSQSMEMLVKFSDGS